MGTEEVIVLLFLLLHMFGSFKERKINVGVEDKLCELGKLPTFPEQHP